MKADISRSSFDRTKHYAAVIQQQGRVQLDADWNEQSAIARYHAEASLRDLVGPSGAPADLAGFAVTLTPVIEGSGGDLVIGAGRYYVDGILCENESVVAFASQPSLPGSVIPAGNVLFYLEVWRRVVTPLDDPSLHEPALGEADTTVRLQTVWQVKAVLSEGEPSPDGMPENWAALTATPTGRMQAAIRDERPNSAAVALFNLGAYEGLENQLYRVEVHTGGDLSTAVLKWSRDNGVVTTTVTSLSGKTLTVSGLGRDAALGFATGQWVEITSAADELAGLPGRLVRIADVDAAALQIVLADPVTDLNATQNLRLRRWDGVLSAAANGQPLTTDSDLEAGISVKFADGTFRAGDFWLIPARAATVSIDWPADTALLPHGVARHFAPLALGGNAQGALQISKDLRRTFAPLTTIVTSAPVTRPPAIYLTAFSFGSPDSSAPRTTQTLYNDGLHFEFSENVVPSCLNDGAFEVTLDQLSYGSSAGSSVVLRLHGSMTISANRVNWRPFNSPAGVPSQSAVNLSAARTVVSAVQAPAENVASASVSSNPLGLRVTLHGAMIWATAADNRQHYLDGMTLHASDGSFAFPSGVSAAASDFTAFFMLPS